MTVATLLGLRKACTSYGGQAAQGPFNTAMCLDINTSLATSFAMFWLSKLQKEGLSEA